MLGKSQVKYIQSLGQKKGRDEAGVFIAEGPKIVAELLAASNASIQQVYATGDWIRAHQQDCHNVELIEVMPADMERLSQLATPGVVLAVVKQFDEPAEPVIRGSLSLVLDTIQDPGNLGTIIRTADWFGVPQVICSRDCADRYNPKVVQSTMGSISRVHVMYEDLESWLPDQKDVFIYAAALEGQNVTVMKPINEGLIVIGNESRGIRPAIMDLVDVRITIPRKGHAESLNAALAAGIILSHIS